MHLWWPANQRAIWSSSVQDRPSTPPATPTNFSHTKFTSCNRWGLRMATWNVWSLSNKFSSISLLTYLLNKFIEVAHTIIAHNLDILTITESWHSTSSDVSVCQAALPSCSCDLPRATELLQKLSARNHSGIVVFYKYTSGSRSLHYLTTWRSSRHFVVCDGPWSTDAADLISLWLLASCQLSSPSSPPCFRCLQPSTASLSSIVTHVLDGWLDDDCAVQDPKVKPPLLSDHGLLLFIGPYLHVQPMCAVRSMRDWKNLDRKAF